MKCKHNKTPEGYISWHEWAEKKSGSHYQVRCPNCGLFGIWKRRTEKPNQDGGGNGN